MTTVIDQCDREVNIPENVQRIVSLVPSQTELLFDLGLEKEVLGITKFCIHPSAWRKEKSIVGGTKSLHIDKIKALSPDLIVANKEENNREDLEIISKFCAVWISDVKNLHESLEMIEDLGKICNRKKKAQEIKNEIDSGFKKLQPLKSPINCLYFIWQKPYMLAGSNTFINDMLKKCGFVNLALIKSERYAEFTEEEILQLNADVIFLSSEPFPFQQKHLEKYNKLFGDAKIILVDGEMFSWYGSRLKLSVDYFNDLIKKVVSNN